MTERQAEWRAAALAEAQRMLASTTGAQSSRTVQMTVGQFRILAQLLLDVASAPPPPAEPAAADPPVRDEGFEGFRFWVPLPQVEAERRELSSLRARVRERFDA